jgi:hypothetical protein
MWGGRVLNVLQAKTLMSSGSFIFCRGGGSFEIISPTVHYCKVMNLLFIYLFIYFYLFKCLY